MESSIFTADACAIDLALDIISKEKHENFIIFSDSLSVLHSHTWICEMYIECP